MKSMEYGNMIDEIERLRKQLDAVLNEIPKNMEFARNEGFKAGREQGAFECRHAKDIARNEALEEAARIILRDVQSARVNHYGWVADRYEYYAKQIRALKSK